MKLHIYLLLLFSCPVIAPAQTLPFWELGGGFGAGDYKGDLQTTKTDFKYFTFSPSVSVHLRRNVNNVFAARMNLLYTGLSADDNNYDEPAWRKIRGISFLTNLLEISALGELYPFGLFQRIPGDTTRALSSQRRGFTPFISLGVGGAYFRPSVDWNDTNGNDALDPMRAQIDKDNTKNISICVPFGAGMRFRVNNRLTLGLEGAIRYIPSDYLDGISQAGNPNANDWFYTVQATASYFLDTPKNANATSAKSVGMLPYTPLPDSDGDGIADKDDQCPNLRGTLAQKGCPDPLTPIPAKPFKAIYFGTNALEWYNTSDITINEIYQTLQSDTLLYARIEGHTNDTGEDIDNHNIADLRAKNCRNYLISLGINPERLKIACFGAKRPIALSDRPDDLELNDRVEVHFYRK